MKFNITYDSSVSQAALGSAANLAGFKKQIQDAAAVFEGAYLDNVTVNVTVKYGSTGLASTLQSYYRVSASTVKDALQKDVTSLDDLYTYHHFGSAGDVYLTAAQIKALGVKATTSGADAVVTFTNSAGLLDFTHSSAMSSTSYDLFGIAAHEFSEVMGRVMSVGTTPLNTIMDTLNSGGSLKLQGDTLLKFNTAATGDKGDWDSSVAASDAYRAFGSPGVVSSISAADMRVVDAVGWDHRARDLVFAIDTTGSMGPYINNVKANAIDILNKAFGTDANPIDARIGIVGFKDAAGPNGPGENTAILNFTDQDTYAARKAAAISAINSISVGGGGDLPEGDNSALLFALQGSLGDWRRAPQEHRIILFTDASIKDYGLAAQVAQAAAKLDVTVTGGSITALSDGVLSGDFTFAPDTHASNGGALGDDTDSAGVINGVTPDTMTVSTKIFVIQVGSDSSATPGLTDLAGNNGGEFFRGDSSNLADIILGIIDTPENRAPHATDDGGFSTAFQTLLAIPTATLLLNDSDPDGDATSVTSVQGAVHGTVALDGAAVKFTPSTGYSGPASFTYTISDGHGGEGTATVDLSVGAPVGPAGSARVDGIPTPPDARGVVQGNGGAVDRISGGSGKDALQGHAAFNQYFGGSGDDGFIISDRFAVAAGAHDGASTKYSDQFAVIFDFEGAGMVGGDFIALTGFTPGSLHLLGSSASSTPGANTYYYSVSDNSGHTFNLMVNSLDGKALAAGDFSFY